MVIYVAAKIGILPGMEIEGMSKCGVGFIVIESWCRALNCR
jgi:hypothetical protein